MLRKGWLWCMVAALPGMACGQSAAPAPAATAADSAVTPAMMSTIVGALETGNVPTLAGIYRKPPNAAMRVLAAMALERIHFHLDQATQDARVCERALRQSQPRVALFYAEFANGNIRLAHGERAADADELDITRRFAGAVPDQRLAGLRHYVDGRRDVPTMDVQVPEQTVVIPLGKSTARDMQTIAVHANGASLPLIIDTGSNIVTLDAKWARTFGVHMTDRVSTGRGLLSTHVRVRHGMLDELTFAGITLRHVPVMVVPGKQRLIGIGVLRHLGILRLAKGTLTVYGRAAALPACREPMLVATDLWGHNLKVLTGVTVNGTLYTPPVDSGSSGFLLATALGAKAIASGGNTRMVVHGIGPRLHHARVNEATVEARIAGQPFQVTLPVFKDASVPWDFVLGSGALDYMDFYFDFPRHHTCMLLHADLH